jgi:alkylhydroperoxidase family enzyme
VITIGPSIESSTTSLELPARSRELVILTVAEYTASPFVTAQHDPIALAAGSGSEPGSWTVPSSRPPTAP